MSVASKNPFDLLGDDGDDSPAPVPVKPKPKAPEPVPAQPPRNIPGSAPRGGRQSSRGAPRNLNRNNDDQRPPRNTGPVPSSGNLEGEETPGGFDGERVAPPKHSHHGPDKHTKPPGSSTRGDYISGGHRSRGGNHVRGAKTPAMGGERRQYERRSGGNPDSQKKVDHGWGANEGGAELTAEVEGETDAVAEENTPQTPAVEGEDGGWGAPTVSATEATAAAPEAAAPEEPEEVQKSYDEFLAERAQQALGGFGKKEGRQVTSETPEGKAFRREALDDFYAGKEKTAASRAKVPKKEKVYIPVDGTFASPPSSGRPTRGSGERGRGSPRGGGGGRAFERGRGAPRGGPGRGAPRGGRGGFGGVAPAPTNDEKAFPALGA